MRRAERIQRQREHEWFGYRLDREGHPGIADLVDMTIEGGEADAEMIGVGLAQFGDVIGNVTAVLRGKIRVAIVEEPQQGRFEGGPVTGGLDRGRAQLIHVLSWRAITFVPP